MRAGTLKQTLQGFCAFSTVGLYKQWRNMAHKTARILMREVAHDLPPLSLNHVYHVDFRNAGVVRVFEKMATARCPSMKQGSPKWT